MTTLSILRLWITAAAAAAACADGLSGPQMPAAHLAYYCASAAACCTDTLGILDDEPDTSGADSEAEVMAPPEPQAPAYPEPPQRSYTLGDLYQV